MNNAVNIVKEWAEKIQIAASQAIRKDTKSDMENALREINGMCVAILLTMKGVGNK